MTLELTILLNFLAEKNWIANERFKKLLLSIGCESCAGYGSCVGCGNSTGVGVVLVMMGVMLVPGDL